MAVFVRLYVIGKSASRSFSGPGEFAFADLAAAADCLPFKPFESFEAFADELYALEELFEPEHDSCVVVAGIQDYGFEVEFLVCRMVEAVIEVHAAGTCRGTRRLRGYDLFFRDYAHVLASERNQRAFLEDLDEPANVLLAFVERRL